MPYRRPVRPLKTHGSRGYHLLENVRADGKHIGVEAGVCLGVGAAGPPLQRLEIRPRHLRDLLAEAADGLCEAGEPSHHPLVYGVPFGRRVLHLIPFLFVRHQPLKGMEITRLVQLQGSIDWQSKDEFPDSVQPFLRKSGCAVCFSAGSFRAAEINRLTRRSISVEEYGELVVGVVQFDVRLFLCYDCLPPVSDRDLGFP